MEIRLAKLLFWWESESLRILNSVNIDNYALLQVLKGLSYLRDNHKIIHRGKYMFIIRV